MTDRDASICNILGEWAAADCEELLKESGKKQTIGRIDNTCYETYIAVLAVGGDYWIEIFDDLSEETPVLIMPFVPGKLGTIAATISGFIDNNV